MQLSDRQTVHVIHVSPGGLNGRGGMGRFVLYLKAAIQGSSPDLRLDVVDSYGPERTLLMPFWFIVAAARVVGAALQPRRVVILHVHMASYGSAFRKLVLMLIGRAVGCRTVLHMHGADYVEFVDGLAWWQRRLLLASMRRAERIVVIGSFWRQYVVDVLDIEEARVRLVHNGVPPPSDPGPPSDGVCRILALGELGRRKGTGELIEALHGLRDHPVPWQAVLAGNGAVEDYRSTVLELGLADRIHLPGWIERDAAQRELATCHLLALPSYQEGLPIAILEAMAMGRAIVATPVGAITDAVVDRQTGLIVAPGDVQGLQEALRELLESPDLRARLGVQAKLRFEQQFDIGRAAELITDLYRELLSSAPGQLASPAQADALAADRLTPRDPC